MTVVETSEAPRPAGHYSQGIVAGGFVFVAGQLPWDPGRPGHLPHSVEEQTERALRNVEAVLVAAGSGLDRLVSVTIFVADISLWSRVNAAYAEVMGPYKPARPVVPTLPLHRGALIEISAIAAAGGGSTDE